MLFDTHTHFNTADFDEDRDQAIERARQAGVSGMGIVGFDQDSIERGLPLVAKHPDMVGIYGWHPTEAGKYNQDIENLLLTALDTDKAVGVGEMGLDFYWDEDPLEVQEKVFRRQIAIAREAHLPVIIHNRDASEDVYRILKDEKIWEIGGIMHTFGESREDAKRFLDLGMHLSFSGVMTFKKTKEVRYVAANCPEDRLLIETDSPYLTPEPKRGQRNESANISFVNNRLADLRQTSYEAMAKITYDNACRLFGIEWTEAGWKKVK
ncbi:MULTISPECIES: TatD family hydrolase [Aerococcus]|uniref:TatD family deoxyribonuclease n=2 Tax=Lactobacillales TaxID=186826 RepID=A0A5N1BT41_9LACT|nr:TatD family hydrolase [Aerococcus urinae]KAA9241522.1 TatD family deoxyribonuclease [Aerococcus urinae]MDK6370703.1 TatD family hydrolase [Aerococcus urinae]MDK6598078.1 TatD family hydrolase [Aerococcus urinae]MDK7302090.1 TatD family hydrolase [Aerococcus urinae]MDK7800960.1 TatD family hydrolase [Aerococcus urinae]